MDSELKLKQDIIEVGRRIYNRGFVAANDGNITIRIGEDEVLTTPTGVSKGFLTPEMLITVDMDGRVKSGTMRPSSELKMHLQVYREREDVRSVVHAHPPHATAFAVAGIPLKTPIMPEVVISLGWVPLAQYGTPSTEEIPESIRPYLQCHDAFLLENHGALTVGTDVYNAYFKMETLDLGAQISLLARQLGQEKPISRENVAKLLEIRKKLGVVGKHPANCAGVEEYLDQCFEEEDLPSLKGLAQIDAGTLAEIVTEVTKRVLAELRDK